MLRMWMLQLYLSGEKASDTADQVYEKDPIIKEKEVGRKDG